MWGPLSIAQALGDEAGQDATGHSPVLGEALLSSSFLPQPVRAPVTPSQDACQNPVTEVLGTPIPILRASAAAILVSLILQL